jgi:hypothetical protein
MLLASLPNGAWYASAAVNEGATGHLDELVTFAVRTATGTSGTGSMGVYAYASIDGGVTYTEGLPGSAGNVSSYVRTPTNLKFLGWLTSNLDSTVFTGGPWSIAGAFNGVLPAYWGVVIYNNTNATLDGTEGSHKKQYQGIWQVTQ